MLNADELLAHRLLKRKLNWWRIGAIGATIVLLLSLISGKSFSNKARPHIARIDITGMITEDHSQLDMLRKIEKRDHIKALILRINSPGGTTTGGEALYQQIRRIAAKRPVVAQFGTMATSAAYMVGIGADHIVARGNSITGSVGVIMQWPEVSQLLKKLGVEMNELKSGALKAEPSPFHKMEEDAKLRSQAMIQESHKWFADLVIKRRKIQPEAIPGFIKGGIFSGRQALSHKLIDEIGGHSAVLNWLHKTKKISHDLKIIDHHVEDKTPFSFLKSYHALSKLIFGMTTANNSNKTGLYSINNIRLLDGLQSQWHF